MSDAERLAERLLDLVSNFTKQSYRDTLTNSATLIRQQSARMAAAVEALTKAAERFREYETSHAAKGSIDGDLKALRNCEMAEMCETALAKIRSQSNG